MGNFIDFRQKLKEHRKRIAWRRRKPVLIIRSKYPFRAEALSMKLVRKNVSKYIDIFNTWFKSHISTWKEQRRRYDSWDTQVDIFLKNLESQIAEYYGTSDNFEIDMRKQVNLIASFVYDLAVSEFGRQMEKYLGTIYYGSEMWWEDIKKQWVSEFIERTKKLAFDYINKTRDTLLIAVRENWSFEKIEAEIQIINSSYTINKVKFIAQDTVGALNGIIEQQLQQSIGINYYVWMTMGDERVRGRPTGLYPKAKPNHWMMDGKVCDWRNPTIWSTRGVEWEDRSDDAPKVHPGRDWRCRCIASPFVIPLIKEIDKEIEKEENL